MYPGGDYEVFRPSWQRHEVDFGGRKGYVKLAREAGVPIVPIASVGGQEAALFLDRGQWLAKLLMVDKLARLKSVPILLAPPWGLTVSDMVPRLPLPTKIAIEVQDPIDADDIAVSDDDVVHDKVEAACRPGWTGWRLGVDSRCSADRAMRVQRQCVVDADRDTVWKVVSNPDCYPEFMASLERWEAAEDAPASMGARYTVHWKVGSVPIGGVIEVVEFDPPRELSWVGLTGVSQRGRFRLRDTADGRTKVTFRLAYESAGNLLGLIADRVAAGQVRPEHGRDAEKPAPNGRRLGRTSRRHDRGRGRSARSARNARRWRPERRQSAPSASGSRS